MFWHILWKWTKRFWYLYMSKYVEYLHRQQWYWHCGTVDPTQTKTICKNRIPCSKVNIFVLTFFLNQNQIFGFLSCFYLTNLRFFPGWREIQHNLRRNQKFNCKNVGTMLQIQILGVIWRNPSNNRKNMSFWVLVNIQIRFSNWEQVEG